MFNKKRKLAAKIAIFMLITTLFLWLLPANLMFGEGEQSGNEIPASTEEQVMPEENIPPVDEEPATTEEQVTSDSVTQDTSAEGEQPAEETPATTDEAQDSLTTQEQGVPGEGEIPPAADEIPAPGINDNNSVVILDPELSTDKPDYSPYETVIISGKGFAPNTDYTITVSPLGSEFIPDSFSVLTNTIGSFDYAYKLNVVASLYHVEAIDSNGNILAKTSFTDCHHAIFLDKSYIGDDGGEVTFQLYSGGSPVDLPKPANSSNGYHIVWSNLPAGQYTVSETSGPDGYDVSISPDSVDITEENWDTAPDDDFTFTAVNTQLIGSITITKEWVDESGAPYNPTNDKADFTLYDGSHTQVGPVIRLDNITTSGTWNDIELGTYTIEETYVSTNVNNWTASAIGPVTVSIANLHPTVNVINSDPKKKTCEVTIYKTVDGVAATGGSFSFSGGLGSFSLPDSGNYYKTFTVDCDKEYTVTEDGASAGYQFDSIANAGNIEVVSQSGSSITFIAHCSLVANPNFNRESSESLISVVQANTITYNNSSLLGSIRLHKTDAVNGADLEGSEWTLYRIAGVPEVQTEVSVQTTDENGVILFSSLAWGIYLVKETDPPKGYLPMEVTVEVKADNLNIELKSEIADPRIPGRIKITKVDDEGVDVPGIGFTLYNKDKTKVIRAEEKTDAAGKLVFDNLDWGTYTLSETDALGYIAADDVQITISASNTEAGAKVTVINSSTTPPEIVVAGIQVLAFTGIDPIVPISGGSSVAAGVAMLIATLRRRRNKYSAKHVIKKENKEGNEWWLSIL